MSVGKDKEAFKYIKRKIKALQITEDSCYGYSAPTSPRNPTMIRTVITLCILLLLTSVASAEVYKWEDANGIHFTDSPASVPEKYREKVYAETREQIQNTAPTPGSAPSRSG
jgi:hypothetical protein